MIKGLRYYYSMFGISGIFDVIKAKASLSTGLLEIKKEGVRFPFYLRYKTSDIPTYRQVFIDDEYDFIVNTSPKVIIDAGANVGLASIYFANKYPDAKIIAIEPELSNFELLLKNVKKYKNITPLHLALWHKNEEINLVDPGLGKWGFMTENNDSNENSYGDVQHVVQAITVDEIIKDFELDSISVLKIDIEGAEREVFSDTSSWINKVDALIVELHDRMKMGCSRSFYKGTNGFETEWQLGENVYLTKGNITKKH